jgi:hypothetical protein
MEPFDIHRADSRGRLVTDWLDAHFSFSFGVYRNPHRQGFSALRVLNEDRIRPGTGFSLHPHSDMEILLLPLAGTVAHADSLGHRLSPRPTGTMAAFESARTRAFGARDSRRTGHCPSRPRRTAVSTSTWPPATSRCVLKAAMRSCPLAMLWLGGGRPGSS